MSTESAFNKKLRPETTFDRIEGVLEHLNLPPAFVEFVRKNRKLAVICVAVLIVVTVVASFYSSYMEQQRNRAASALSLAEEQSGAEKIAAFEKVVADFSATDSSRWAKIGIAQEQMKEGKYQEAANQYGLIMEDVGSKSPLWPLLVFGRAGALEGAQSWEKAIADYTALQEISGYESLGHLGVGRIYLQQDKLDKALEIYNNFLLKAGDEPRMQADKKAMEAEIARVKILLENKGTLE